MNDTADGRASRYVPTDSTACKDCESFTPYHVNEDGYNPKVLTDCAAAGQPLVFNCLQRRQQEEAPALVGRAIMPASFPTARSRARLGKAVPSHDRQGVECANFCNWC